LHALRMRAIQLTRFGDPSVLVPVELPDPLPAEDQVVIDVEVASISFVETQIRAGRPPRMFPLPDPPFVPGGGVGGVVSAVGTHVDAGLIGQRVASLTGGVGGYAEKAAADVAGLIPIPAGRSTADGVRLATDGATAVGLFRLAAPVAGERVLVEAAAGGLGSLLVQLALGVGAQVIGAVGGDGKLDVVGKAGARAVDYRQPDWTGTVRDLTGGAAIDVVFDGVGGSIGAAAAGLLGPEGRFVIHGGASGTMTDPASVSATVLTLRDVREDRLDLAKAAIVSGLKPLVGATFPLERAADAHAAIEARRTVGKTLLVV
jgi:NADPH2:quinone reductase